MCFYDGMKSSDKVCLQFVFPIYIWITIGLIIIAVKWMTSYCIFKPITQYLIHLKLTHVFAMLLLLSYTKIIQTVTIIFNRYSLGCDSNIQYRWYYDRNIPYGQGPHLPLLAFGAVFAVV